MGFESVRRWAPALSLSMLLAFTSLLLPGCGGGGGGGDGMGGGDGGGGGSNPPPSGLSGRLWHTNYALDFLDGTQIASPSGSAPSRVTTELPAWPWLDGSQYVVADADASDGTTEVTIL